MFFLGHMCWAYIFGKATGQLTSRMPQIQLSIICSILPDVDLLLRIEHGGIMHSIAFWIIVYVPLLLCIGPRRGLPYLVSTLQHLLFGDFITSRYKILLPFNRGYGLGLGLLSPISLSLEVLGFSFFIVCTYFTQELMLLFSMKSRNLLSLLPAVAMLVSIIFVLRLSYISPFFEAIQALFMLLLLGSFLMGMVEEIRYKYLHG